MSYTILEGGKAIRCGDCQRVSWNKHDVLARYCGRCHKYHERRATAHNPAFAAPYGGQSYEPYGGMSVDRVWIDDARPSSSEDVCRPDPTPDTSSSIDYGNSSCDSGSSGGWSD